MPLKQRTDASVQLDPNVSDADAETLNPGAFRAETPEQKKAKRDRETARRQAAQPDEQPAADDNLVDDKKTKSKSARKQPAADDNLVDDKKTKSKSARKQPAAKPEGDQ